MNIGQLIQGIQGSPTVYRAGWALVHSLWLGAAVAAVLAAVLVMLRRRPANVRYFAACAALAATVALVLGTFMLVQPRAERPGGQEPVHGASMTPVPAQPAGQDMLDDVPLPPEASAPVPAADSEVSSIAARAPKAWTARISDALEPALPWVVSAWSAGVCVLLVWHLGGWLAVGRLRRQARELADGGPVEITARLARALRVSRPVRLLESAIVRVPTVAGWLRPAILLPVSLASGLAPQQIEAILAHELAHIRRWDYLVNLLQSLVETVLFYHPAVWWVSRRVRAERENACDDLAVAIGQERSNYAESLARVAELARTGRRETALLARPAVGAVRRPSELRDRIFRLLKGDSGCRVPFPESWPGALATAAAILCLAPFLIHAAATQPTPNGANTRAGADAAEIDRLIKRLGSDRYADRNSAQMKLIAMGWPAIPELSKARQHKDPEIGGRAAKAIEAILATIETRSKVLENLKKYDAIYESGFSASGTGEGKDLLTLRSGAFLGVKRRWKLTYGDDRFGYTADVIDHEKLRYQHVAERQGTERRPVGQTSGQDENADRPGLPTWIRTRRWGYWGHDLSGHYYEDTLFEVTPKDEATVRAKGLKVCVHGPRDIGPTPSKYGFLWAFGRTFSKQLDKVTRVEQSKDGLLVVSALGRGHGHTNGRWELDIDPDAAWMVRKARFYSNAQPERLVTEMTNSGTVWSGSYCIPKEAKINCFRPIGAVETKHLTFDPVVGSFDERLYSTVQQAVVHNKEPRLEVHDYRVSPKTVTQPNRPKPEGAQR